METEKRRFVRKRTDQLLYAEFGADNGSILLNLCEEGCSFQSMAPVRAGNVRFSLSVGDGRKLEGDGEMVWSDPAQRIGGLRFVNPSKELRERVREWLDDTLVTADGQLDTAAVESRERRARAREEARIEAQLTPKGEETRSSGATADGEMQRNLGVALAPQTGKTAAISGVGWPDDAQLHLPQTHRGSWRGLSTMALIAAMLVAMIVYHRELGHWVVWTGSRIAGDDLSRSGAAETGRSVPDSPRPEAQLTPAYDNNGKESGIEVLPASTEETTTTTSGGGIVKQASAPVPVQAVETEDVPALWAGVENGDTRAELALAMRYVVGNGVPKSCAQARVLLQAAAKRGSLEARQELEELPQAGCR